jgi:hypothetical protein
MSRKLVTKAEKKPKVDVIEHAEQDVKEFEFGTIVLRCACGNKQELMKHVQYGIQFIIATTDKSGVTLHCDKCHSELRLACEEGTPPPEDPEINSEDTTKENEDIPQESKEGESL